MDNPVSLLHEYCSKYKLDKPYISYTSSGPDNSKTWICKLVLTEMVVTSDQFPTKKTALAECCKQILKKIKYKKTTRQVPDVSLSEIDNINTKLTMSCNNIPEKTIFNKKKIIVLVDLENKKIEEFNEDFIYIGFIKKTDPKNIKLLEDWKICNNFFNLDETGKLLYCVEGSNKELVDHFITSFIIVIANIIKNNINTMFEIYFLTGDHSAYCSKICYQTFFDMMKLTNYRLSNIIHQKYIDL